MFKFDGYGTYIYNDGTIYQGHWSKGLKNKKGIMYLPNGDIIDGHWKGDKIDNAIFRKGHSKHLSMFEYFFL